MRRGHIAQQGVQETIERIGDAAIRGRKRTCSCRVLHKQTFAFLVLVLDSTSAISYGCFMSPGPGDLVLKIA